MDNNLSARLFTTVIPLNMAKRIFTICLDHYQFYYLFTPSRQVLKKRDGQSSKDEKRAMVDFDCELLNFAYACGRFFDKKGELAWISEDGSIYCCLCSAELPDVFKSLSTWNVSDFTMLLHKEHKLFLWDPKKKTGQWQDGNIPRNPLYGIEGEGRPVLSVRDWSSEDKKEKYIQYASIERMNLDENRNSQTKRQDPENG